MPLTPEVVPLDLTTIESLRPWEWGVEVDCWVRLYDLTRSTTRLLKFVPAGGSVQWRHDGLERPLVLSFRRVAGDGSPSAALGSVHSWAPSSMRGTVTIDSTSDAALTATHRSNVVLAPHLALSVGTAPLATKGYVGAWEGGQLVPEIMDFALGRPYYSFHAPTKPLRKSSRTVIYLGPPQGSWGHFLTQSLSRIWYALAHPEIPVIWDSGSLAPWQLDVLQAIGLQNDQLFLTERIEYESVVFPVPGVSIGDYVASEFTDSVARVEPSAMQPGKRLFLSRTLSGAPISPDERNLDLIAERNGYEVFHPQQHSVREQLHEISSSEIIFGVESSAFHTVVLLRGQLPTTFWALSRHRGGSGVFEHIKQAKRLRYETLNFLKPRKLLPHDAPLELDLAAIENAVRTTHGLKRDTELLAEHLEQPWPGQSSFGTLVGHMPFRRSRAEEALAHAHTALWSRDRKLAATLGAAV